MNDETKFETPFERLFGLDAGSTEPLVPETKTPTREVTPLADIEPLPLALSPDAATLAQEDRAEDIELTNQFADIQSKAMQAFREQHMLSQTVEPKFSARNAEVAAQFLTIALSATKDRSKAKYDRQKMRLATSTAGSPTQVQNNLIVADRNTLLKDLFKQDFEQTLQQQMAREVKP